MKQIKTLLTVVMSVVMLMALTIPAIAAGETGSLTVSNAVADQTYSIYKIFDLETTADGTGFKYTVRSEWEGFVTGDGAGAAYVTVNADDVVTWNDGDALLDTSVQAFSQAATKYVADNCISAVETKIASGSDLVFSNLAKGYYLLTSSLGDKSSLATVVDRDVTVLGKNAAPTITKEVKENSTGTWGETNDANIGEIVEFKSVINVTDGNPINYVMHDTLSNGLTFDKITKVTINGTEVDSYDVTFGECELCTFQIKFNDVQTNDVIEVYYQAILNENAVIAGAGNPNEIALTYGLNNETTHDFTYTFTWQYNVLKVNSKNATLPGAKFQMKDSAGNLIKFAKAIDGKEFYHVDPNGTYSEIVTINNGAFNITGLDAGTYTLEETEAPTGYNKLSSPITITIDHNGKVNVTEEEPEGLAGNTLKVVNIVGTELPATGGMGTTIFYIVGSVLVVGAVVILVVRKRLESER